jgi:quinol monooxygenase YgiN
VERVKKPALVLSKTRKRTRRDTNKTAQSYSSGEWLVREGSEEDFTVWPFSDAPGDKSFVLVRSTDEPRRFLSLKAWENQEAQESWRGMPRIQELLSQCRELCEEVEFHPYTLAASQSR